MARWTKSRTVRSFYKFYKYRLSKDRPEYVNQVTYTKIMNEFFYELNKFLRTGEEYKIPYGLGAFRICKYKINSKYRNYNAERIYHKETGIWKKIGYRNFHTDGYRLKVVWFIEGYTQLPMNGFYKFKTNQRKKGEFVKDLKSYGDIGKYMSLERKIRIRNLETLI